MIDAEGTAAPSTHPAHAGGGVRAAGGAVPACRARHFLAPQTGAHRTCNAPSLPASTGVGAGVVWSTDFAGALRVGGEPSLPGDASGQVAAASVVLSWRRETEAAADTAAVALPQQHLRALQMPAAVLEMRRVEEWVGDKSCIPSPTSACSFMRKALSVTVDGASRSRFAAASEREDILRVHLALKDITHSEGAVA